MGNSLNINIMMIGGRRCGKTSVLAAMLHSFDGEFGKSNLTIKADDQSIRPLSQKYNEMKTLYAKKNLEPRFTPDDSPTNDIEEYGIEISLKTKSNGRILYKFIDIPGEWLSNNIEDVTKTIKKSSVIVVAIDTPYLMEEAIEDSSDSIGIYNEDRNYSGEICGLLKNLDLNKEEKMVVFVPLKAERYWHEGKMDLVNKRVHVAYKEFFDHVNNDFYRKSCTTVIAPIFTLGTVEFTRFKRNGADIDLDDKYGTPKYPLYAFTDDAKNSPESKYCEQPLLYVLLYILKAAAKAKENKKRLGKFLSFIGEKFLNMPSANDFLVEVNNIQKYIKTSGDGYQILTDPYGLKGVSIE